MQPVRIYVANYEGSSDNESKYAFVTAKESNLVIEVDASTQKITCTVPVGEGPNGISYWFENGGMP